jgi:YbgC/YbaW family acyl-CoA thioester hydrolase
VTVGEAARLSLKVRHYEVDQYGHVNHAQYVHYLEVARTEALEALGLSLPEMRRLGYLIVAVELSVKYLAQARSGELLDVVTHVREIRGARSFWVQEIRDAASQRLLVTAEVTGAFTTEDGRPARIPPGFREKLAALYVPDAGSAPGK